MKNYWDNYYNDFKGVLKPSSFSKHCKKFLKIIKVIFMTLGVEMAEIQFFFNKNKLKCIGLDQSSAVIKLNKKKFKKIKNNFIKKNFVSFLIRI